MIGIIVMAVLALLSGLLLLGCYILDGVVQMKRVIPTLALIPLFSLFRPGRDDEGDHQEWAVGR